MRHRKKKPSTNWRISWYQLVDGVRYLKWHTGSFGEVEILRRACEVAGESYAVSAPNQFK